MVGGPVYVGELSSDKNDEVAAGEWSPLDDEMMERLELPDASIES